jgi:ribosomal protein S7
MRIKTKLINHLTLNGKKEVGEKNLLKSIKELQKSSIKKSDTIFQLALINSTPIFKLHRIRNKKIKKNKTNKFREIPGFIKNKNTRTSLAIKFILLNAKHKGEPFYKNFYKEILLNAAHKGTSIQTKNDLQKNVITKKHYFRYYRWN